VRTLLVEDDDLLVESLTRGLGAEGYAVDVARDGIDGLHQACENAYDVMILDIMLPGLNGYQVCAALRQRRIGVPVLMLTAKDGAWDQAEGLDCGADDYLVKPFHFVVLLARLRALLRRGPSRSTPVLYHGELSLDPATHRCARAGTPIDLTPREFALLHYLMRHPGAAISKQELLDHVWGDRYAWSDPDLDHHNVVEVHISSLRRKLAGPGRPGNIQTVRGVGYLLCLPSDRP
jgi:DNA-binding response OmpR family regulator